MGLSSILHMFNEIWKDGWKWFLFLLDIEKIKKGWIILYNIFTKLPFKKGGAGVSCLVKEWRSVKIFFKKN